MSETKFNEITENDDFENKPYKKLITIGICSRFYLFIIYSGIFKMLSMILLGSSNKKYSEDGIGLFGFSPNLVKFSFMQSIYKYLGFIIFGIIFHFFKSVGKAEKKIKINVNNLKNHYSLIYTTKNKYVSIYTIKMLLLTTVSFIFFTEVKKFLYKYGLQFSNFWTIEILWTYYFLKKYFIVDYYKHHKIAIIFIISSGSIFLLAASFLPNSLNAANPRTAYENVKNFTGSYYYCFLITAFFVFLSCNLGFSRAVAKALMEIDFISPYAIITSYGIFGFIVCLIASIISYKIDYSDNLVDYFSSLKLDLDQGKKYKFYAEIFGVSISYAFICFMEITFEILTIYYLNPFYVLMTDAFYFLIIKLIEFLMNMPDDKLFIIHFILAEIPEILVTLGYMVFLEIIELNFCGLNKNLRTAIIEKGEDEFKILSNSLGKREISIDIDDDYYYNDTNDVNNEKEEEHNQKIKIEMNLKNDN